MTFKCIKSIILFLSDSSCYMLHHRPSIIIMSLAQRSAGSPWSLLTWVRYPDWRFKVSNKIKNCQILPVFCIIHLIRIMRLIFQVTALLATLELQESARRKGHFALYNCLVLGHTKYSGVQRVYCNPFPAKTFHASHRMDFVMIRPPGIDNGAFVVSPDTVWYARVLLLFSASAATDTGSKSFDCALVSTLESYDDPDNGKLYRL